MENDSKFDVVNSLEELKKHPDYILSRVLFQKFNTLHDFHINQLGKYSISCCNISYGGVFKINPEEKTVIYSIRTERSYYLKEDKKIKRNKYSLIGYAKVPPKKYRKEYKQAKKNLEAWVRNLLWTDSKIELYFDQEDKDEQ